MVLWSRLYVAASWEIIPQFLILSQVAVFEVDRELLKELYVASQAGEEMSRFQGRSTLRLVQSISTIPGAFPTTMNTCGRICVHRSGRFVVVSNRGHQSITVYKVKSKGGKRGELQTVGHFHTRGETPRHFQFDNSGQYLLVANQDTDSIAVFNFNLSSGELKFSGNDYRVPSPNFVCCCPSYREEFEEREISRSPVPVFSSNASAISDTASDSDESTVNIHDRNKLSLHEQLMQARIEIEKLRQMLAQKA